MNKMTPRALIPVQFLPITVVACIFFIFILLNSSPYQQSDTANYYFEGLLITKGYLPYLDFNDNKGPLLYYLLALAASISQWQMIGGIVLFRLLDCVVFFALFRLLRKLGFSLRSQVLAMASFVLAYAACFIFRDETIYSETPELLLRIFAYTCYLTRGGNFRAGILIAIAALFRQTAAIDIGVIALDQLLLLGARKNTLKQAFQNGFLILSGFLVPLLLIASVAFFQGWIGEYYRHAILWNFNFSQLTVNESPAYLPLFEQLASLALIPCVFFSLFWAILHLLKLARRKIPYSTKFSRGFLLIAVCAHLFESAASPLLYVHHFIPSLMILTICAADLFDNLAESLSPFLLKGAQCGVGLTLSAFALCLGLMYASQYSQLEADALPDLQFAQWIAEHTSPTDEILVWGYAPQMYLYTQRLPASRYHFNLFLTNQSGRFQSADLRPRDEFRADIKNNSPRYVLLPDGETASDDFFEFAPEARNNYSLKHSYISGREVYFLEAMS